MEQCKIVEVDRVELETRFSNAASTTQNTAAIRAFFRSSSGVYQDGALENPNAPSDILSEAGRSKHYMPRFRAARHDNTPNADLLRLLKDPDTCIAVMARDTLTRKGIKTSLRGSLVIVQPQKLRP